ncbi:hypothetical protein V8J88_08585 [Massilia sp. W12]|uniref:hypothetical protein n=1 Tax=Massilia sp. W12 TaxID=3126507 RepID=UPI0030CC27F4
MLRSLPSAFRHSLLCLCAAGLCLTGQTASAGELAALSIIDLNSGNNLPIWRHQGRNYCAGQAGQRYALRITNKTGQRLLAVVAVDGVNVINGETAHPRQAGYVLDAWQQTSIEGWRKSMSEVAAFYFTNPADSYAGRTGRAHQSGVIGVALYREMTPPPVLFKPPPAISAEAGRLAERDGPYSETPAKDASAQGSMSAESAKRAAPAAAPTEKLGTGHGERINSESSYTDFKRASRHPAETLTVYYDSYANLQARGIIPRHRPNSPNHPSPFPGGFTPDPN